MCYNEIDVKKNVKDLGVSIMADNKDFQAAEYYEGTWNGESVRFKRVYAQHRFTDRECEALLRGESIVVDDFMSQKTGKLYSARGCLARKVYNDREYVGFNVEEYIDRIPDEYLGHRFTGDELDKLYNGEHVLIEGYVSKKGSRFDADTTWEDGDNGRKRLTFHFDD